MANIIKQRFGNICHKSERAKIYIQDKVLSRIGLAPGSAYQTEVLDGNKIVIQPTRIGNTVSYKKRAGEIVPVIDKAGSEINEALKDCSQIIITFYEKDGEGWVEIRGILETATVTGQPETEHRKLRSITFCAGAGISAMAGKDAGFQEVAGVEWNPPTKEGSQDKFANIFEQNHPDAVVFNVPMQRLSAKDLPRADVWMATLDCTDYSKLKAGREDYHTIHLFMHLYRLFMEKPIEERPKAIFIENVPQFQAIAGNSLALCLKEEGYSVEMQKVDSLDFGSRTKRERFFMVATAWEGFKFPEPTGRKETPIATDGVITVDSLDWKTSETSGLLKYFIGRQEGKMTHNHKITSFDITKDFHIGTLPKSHYKGIPENLIRHPWQPNTFAFLRKQEHLKYLHGIPEKVYLGDSTKVQIECIGQGIAYEPVLEILRRLHNFMVGKMFTPLKQIVSDFIEESGQLALNF